MRNAPFAKQAPKMYTSVFVEKFLLFLLLVAVALTTRSSVAQTSEDVLFSDGFEAIVPVEISLVEGLSSAAPGKFNSTSSTLVFSLTGARFYQDRAEIILTLNGNQVPSSQLYLDATTITAHPALADGKNTISLSAVDENGVPLHYTETIWAGNNRLKIDIKSPDGSPIVDPTTVTLRLADDESVGQTVIATAGTVTVPNLPFRTIHLIGSSTNYRRGTASVVGIDINKALVLTAMGEPSDIDNNDFSLGTQGWEVGSSPVSVQPHIEDVFPGPNTGSSKNKTGSFNTGNPVGRARVFYSNGRPIALPLESAEEPSRDRAQGSRAEPDSSQMHTTAEITGGTENHDLVLNTGGQGQQSISRTFNMKGGTTSIRVRYRFVTTEVPGGFFGSQYNDTFSVSIRSQSSDVYEANSMNGLGLASFNQSTGSTAWREITLSTDSQVATRGSEARQIRVDLSVANVGDGLYPSQVIVDLVEDSQDQVKPVISWNNTVGGLKLDYEILNGPLAEPARIDIFWASSSSYSGRIGSPIFSYSVATGAPQGPGSTVLVGRNLLNPPPASAKYLIASSAPAMTGSLPDVAIQYDASAVASVVSDGMVKVIKGGLRNAGQKAGRITSTARDSTAQARAMFLNLTDPSQSISANIQEQLQTYLPPGRAVVNLFAQLVQGLTRDQILSNQASIRSAMRAEIDSQGCHNVSRHCADPSEVSVVDVGASAFNSNNGPLFVSYATPRVTHFIDERSSNHCYHLELEN